MCMDFGLRVTVGHLQGCNQQLCCGIRDDLCVNSDTGLWHVLPPDWHKVLLIAAMLPGRCLIFYSTGQQGAITWSHLHSGPNLLAACKLWRVSVTAMISLAFHAMQQSQDSVMPIQSKECVCHTSCLTDLWCYVGLVGLFASKAAAQLVAQQTLQQAKPAAADPPGSPFGWSPIAEYLYVTSLACLLCNVHQPTG